MVILDICAVMDPDEKSHICGEILRSIPDWFGNPAAIVDYTNTVRDRPLFAAFDGETPVGFAALTEHNAYTAEICVMGIREAYHRQGIGRRLVACCENRCAENDRLFLTVKTLDASANSEHYDRTRQFYCTMGFVPLEVFPMYWDVANPCLYMAKTVSKQETTI